MTDRITCNFSSVFPPKKTPPDILRKQALARQFSMAQQRREYRMNQRNRQQNQPRQQQMNISIAQELLNLFQIERNIAASRKDGFVQDQQGNKLIITPQILEQMDKQEADVKRAIDCLTLHPVVAPHGVEIATQVLTKATDTTDGAVL